MTSAVIDASSIPNVTIKTNMFMGCFALHPKPGSAVDVRSVTTLLSDPNKRVSCFTVERRPYLLEGLHIKTVKFARKGRLGDVLHLWNESDIMEVPLDIQENTGSIQISCLTVPFDLKVSIFFFSTGQVKVSGALLDPCTAGMNWLNNKNNNTDCQASSIVHEYETLNSGMQSYLDEIKMFTCTVLGGTSIETTFVPSLMNGQFELGMHISNVNQLSLLAATSMTDLFSHVRGQEPEINGRRFSVQMFLKGKDKLQISFDHFGKVQIFSAKSFSDMVLCWKVFIDMITRALDNETVCLSDITPRATSGRGAGRGRGRGGRMGRGGRAGRSRGPGAFDHFISSSDSSGASDTYGASGGTVIKKVNASVNTSDSGSDEDEVSSAAPLVLNRLG
jgi:hypothetical protein